MMYFKIYKVLDKVIEYFNCLIKFLKSFKTSNKISFFMLND